MFLFRSFYWFWWRNWGCNN